MKKTVHVISVSGGKDSTALLLLALQRCPKGSVYPIFCDTGNEHAQVHTYLDYLEQALGIRITRLKANFDQQIAAKRRFIARDTRTRREYDTEPVFEADGITPVPARDGRGQIIMNAVRRNGIKVMEPKQKTRKIGGGRRVRWTNKAKRRALEVLHPTGNPFLDLCLWKGRFPSRKAQFCTEELKRNIAVAYQLDMLDAGHNVISWQGVRRDESLNRANAKLAERIASGLWAFRPLVLWTADDVFSYCAKQNIRPNPLYLQGMGRVGCMPCINVNRNELQQISVRFPNHLDEKARWEMLVSLASKRGFSTFFCKELHKNGDKQDRRAYAANQVSACIQWANTSRGGRQFNFFADLIDAQSCASAYGLCE